MDHILWRKPRSVDEITHTMPRFAFTRALCEIGFDMSRGVSAHVFCSVDGRISIADSRAMAAAVIVMSHGLSGGHIPSYHRRHGRPAGSFDEGPAGDAAARGAAGFRRLIR